MADSSPHAKVLIVNDDPSTLLALSSILSGPEEEALYTVFMVQSGEEALREVLKHDFAVILLDVSMPGMDGFETAEAIRSHPRSASVPIIFITAYYGDELNRMKGYQKGGADYLFAPIIPQVVQTKVAVFVELNLKTQELQRKTAALQAINTDLRYQRLLDLERVNIQLQTEIDERRAAEARGQDLVGRDSLTGLLNRQKFLQLLGDHLATANEAGLIYFDLDNFKNINNEHGNEAGDLLLKQVAEKLAKIQADGDQLARVGSDEFAFLIAHADRDSLVDAAKKIAAAMGDINLVNDQSVTLSATLGTALFPVDGDSAENLFRFASTTAVKQKSGASVKVASKK
jgi:diguanylate cyclase